MALTKITPQMFDTSAAGHDFNIDNGTFVVDASANRVGIGTATPSTLLHVDGTATATTFVGALTGNVTGNVSGTAATVTGAAQTNITSVGTLSSLTVSGALNGTLSTAAQPNITSTGILNALSIAGNLTVDTNTLHVDASNNAVVIGGTNPQAGGLLTLEGPDANMLVLHRTADGGDQEILFYDHGDHNATIAGKNGGGLRLLTNGRNTTALDLTSGGNATFSGEVLIPEKLTHAGDTDTHFKFAGANDIRIVAGNVEHAAFDVNTIVFNQSGANMDFRVESTNNENMLFVDAGLDRVGINQNAPLALLDIKGNTTTYAGMAKIYLTDSNSNSESRNWSIGNGGSGYGHFTIGMSNAKDGDPQASGTHTNPLVIDHTGKVGIGLDHPSSPLHVSAANNAGWVAQIHNTGTGSDANGLDIHAGVDSSDYILRTRHQDGTDAMVVKHGGKVGIGHNGPDEPLHVKGSGYQRVKIQSTGAHADLQLKSGGSTTQWFLFNDSDSGNNSGVIKYQHSDNTMRFRANDVDNKLVVSSHGVGFNTATATANNSIHAYQDTTGWTPRLFKGSTEVTGWTGQYGYYIQIGDLVWVSFYLYKSSGAQGSVSGNWRIYGLPFNITPLANGAYQRIPAGYFTMNGVNYFNTSPHGWQGNSTTYLEMYGNQGTTSWTSSIIEMAGTGVLSTYP